MAYIKVRVLSLKARAIIAAVMIAVVGVLALIGYLKFRELTAPGTSAAAEESLVAGDSFEPGAKERLYGTETEAFLDGLHQKVRAWDPSPEWREAFPSATCGEGDQGLLCVADALPALPSMGDAADAVGDASVGFADFIISLIPYGALPMLVLVGILVLVLNDES